MLDSHTLEGSAMISKKFRGETNQGQNVRSENKKIKYSKPLNREEMWCSYCKKPRHTIENCFKIHGKNQVHSRNAGLKVQQRGQTHFTNGQRSTQEKLTLKSDEIELNKEEINKLRNLLNSLSEPSSTCSLAQSGKCLISYSFSASDSPLSSSWIIDSKAIDHMTHTPTRFVTYNPCPGNRKVSVADGSLVTVAGQGTINDQVTERTIGFAKERNGLYYLDESPNPSAQEKVSEKDNDDTMEFLEFDSLPKGGPLTSLKKSVSPNPQNLPEIPTTLPEMEPEPIDEIQLENQQPSVKSIAPLHVYSRKRVPIPIPMQIHESEPDYLHNTEAFLTTLNSISIPRTLQEALKDKNWIDAMREEMHALEKNKTWEIVSLPDEKKSVGCKWVFTLKYKADGSLERYKARLVAKGYTQTYGIYYQETFAPVAKMNTKEVYMDPPPGFDENFSGNKVCRLKKALYGLKQSPRAWFGRFTKVMLAMGCTQSQGDHTLFVKHSAIGEVTILLVYVDDIIVTGNDPTERDSLRKCLAKEFEIKELGKLKYFLGIEVAYSKHGIFLSQRKYVLDLLKETGTLGCKAASTPIEPNHKMVGDQDDTMATLGRRILFKKGKELAPEAYTDADYAGSMIDRRSTSGYCTFLGGNLITWRSKKQPIVARSSAEGEFRAMAHGICKLLWLKIIVDNIRVKREGPMKLYCDNKSAINIAHNPVQHDRTKHIEVDRHFIKEKLDSGLISTAYMPSSNHLADVLTKGLPTSRFQELTNKLGMENIYSPA
ncbi:UNVERIFIED_CONTAM: Retrovirus-related Pol polyprotein from transposon RE1 [Sesamum latifolium]|uniref:Retrovirus-related Pol polyprotein from transposon RE1 n=1 Tax=Sesamum latifolium TaxID=2727402 RepID=A0AAW2U309_9LAMI